MCFKYSSARWEREPLRAVIFVSEVEPLCMQCVRSTCNWVLAQWCSCYVACGCRWREGVFFSVGIVKIEICEADVNAGDSEGDSPLAHARALAGHWQKKGVCWKTHVMSISQYNTIYDIYVACSDLPTDIVGCMWCTADSYGGQQLTFNISKFSRWVWKVCRYTSNLGFVFIEALNWFVFADSWMGLLFADLIVLIVPRFAV